MIALHPASLTEEDGRLENVKKKETKQRRSEDKIPDGFTPNAWTSAKLTELNSSSQPCLHFKSSGFSGPDMKVELFLPSDVFDIRKGRPWPGVGTPGKSFQTGTFEPLALLKRTFSQRAST